MREALGRENGATPAEPSQKADLAIIGAGASAAYALRHLLERLAPATRPLRIALVAPEGRLEGGVAYGPRSGRRSLLITGLDAFLPSEERERFARWAGRRLRSECGDGARVPRELFGRYLFETSERAIERARARGVARVDFVVGTAHDIVRAGADGPFDVRIAGASGAAESVRARRVLLCIGSPAFRSMLPMVDAEDRSCRSGPPLVDAPYADDLDAAIERAVGAARVGAGERPARLLVVGSNASALEVVHHLEAVLAGSGGRGHVTVVSGTGTLPVDASDGVTDPDYRPHRLESSSERVGLRADELFEAAREDLERAARRGLSLDQYAGPINRLLLLCLQRMEVSERRRFLQRHANRLGRYQRRAESAYLDAARRLDAAGALESVRGRVGALRALDGRWSVRVETAEGPCVRTADAVFNCTGPALPRERPCALLSNLFDRGLAAAAPDAPGLEVDERYRTAGGVHVFGPLLAGNVVGDRSIWHLEHCGRIFEISKDVALELDEELRPDRAAETASSHRSHSRQAIS